MSFHTPLAMLLLRDGEPGRRSFLSLYSDFGDMLGTAYFLYGYLSQCFRFGAEYYSGQDLTDN